MGVWCRHSSQKGSAGKLKGHGIRLLKVSLVLVDGKRLWVLAAAPLQTRGGRGVSPGMEARLSDQLQQDPAAFVLMHFTKSSVMHRRKIDWRRKKSQAH